MKWIKYKKTAIIFFLILLYIFAVGFGKKSVDLLKKDLLDFDKAIEAANWGVEDIAKSEMDNSEESSDETADENSVSRNRSYTKTIKVRINGKKILIDGEECAKEEIEKNIKAKYTGMETVKIFDDYAEAHVYKEVDKLLAGLSDSMGFEYDEGN